MLKVIEEDKVVKFNGSTYPKNGWCVILAGGPGSGKGTAYKNLIPIHTRKFDPDDLSSYIDKKFDKQGDYITVRGNEYDSDNAGFSGKDKKTMKDPDYVEYLHSIRKGSGLQKSKWDSMWKGLESSGNLTNIAFDITGSREDKIINIVNMAKSVGYKISLVYILNDIDQQIINNKQRDRTVPDNIVREITKDVYNTLVDMVNNIDTPNNVMNSIDECWAITALNVNMKTTDGKYEYITTPNVFQLKAYGSNKVDLSVGDVASFIKAQLDKIDPDGNSLSESYYYYHMYTDLY